MSVTRNYDVIVVGGGHAGVEAASASARLGSSTLLLTPDLGRVGQMSCNPAIGGVAKGVVAREVAALGGVMGRATDASRIQFRMLNRRKGPAVWGPRAQCDRGLYPRAVRRCLDEIPSLDLFQDLVTGLHVEGNRVVGIHTRSGLEFSACAIVITAGTFLRGRVHVGGQAGVEAGRAGEAASVELAVALEEAGLEVRRFKTGTPPRVDGRTVDFSRLERQDGDPEDFRFAPFTREVIPEQLPCWITWTGPQLADVVQRNLMKSALYGGEISGQGPRYCPSIEDKIVRFPDARRHQVFLEPEGLETTELYVNGLSTSLPHDVQEQFVRTVPGLEEARLTKTGYAIEYDYFPPHQLRQTLEVRALPGLFFAGQINGTTGYEEAAGQGLVAGLNAALKVQGRDPFILERHEAYIGVLVDDLVTKGVDEPYRLFTSRAEFRLLLRQDNAVDRLSPLGRDLGLLNEEETRVLKERESAKAAISEWFDVTKVSRETSNDILEGAGSTPVDESMRARDLLKRPEVGVTHLLEGVGCPLPIAADSEVWIAAEIELKYEGYVRREADRAARLAEQASVRLPEDLDYTTMFSLRTEARQKLARVTPETLAQAGRVPGVSPADLQNLLMEVRKHRRTAPSES